MAIEDQVPLLETSALLPIIDNTCFFWVGSGIYEEVYVLRCASDMNFVPDRVKRYPAPTIQELLDVIPLHISNCYFTLDHEECGYINDKSGEYVIAFDGPNLAEAMAQLLLWINNNEKIKRPQS